LFTPPCFAAIGAMHAEIRSAKWFWGGIGLQFIVGFTISFFVYQIGTLLTTGLLGEGFVFGLLAVIIFAAILVSIIVKANRSDSVK
jgi:ferrous iron transport protein B